MKHIVQSRWFALADLAFISTAGLFLFLKPRLGWWPLIIALVPWLLRITAGRFPFQRTQLDLFLLFFLMTAIMGVWPAYDQLAAWGKFRLIAAAVLVYYAVAGQPQSNLWILAGIGTAIGLAAAAYFLYTRDWQTVDPALVIHPNVAAGLIALTFPFSVAGPLRAWQARRSFIVALLLVLPAALLVNLFLTASRGAVMALGVAAIVWLLWGLSQYLARRTGYRPSRLFIGLLFSVGLLSSLLLFQTRLIEWNSMVAGLIGSGSRSELMADTLRLIADFPVTGSGLGSFPGLYSQYMLGIPSFFIGHGHNLFLNVALEQSLFGLLALLGILFGTGWSLVRGIQLAESESRSLNLLRWATLLSLIVMVLHSLIDDTLYGQRGAPLLFVVPAMSMAVVHISAGSADVKVRRGRPLRDNHWVKGAVALAVVLITILFGFRRQVTASWYSNLGAIKMAQVELAGWPTGKWDEGRNVAALTPAAALFERALSSDPDNRTAQHRLGLIAMLQRDFETAALHLDAAHRLDGAHHGILKSLTYSYVWLGELERAAELASDVPEAQQEMGVYSWWWETQGREDLAENARQMVSQLEAAAPVTD